MCGKTGPVTSGNIMRRMRFACRLNKVQMHKHVIYNTYGFYTATVVTLTQLGITF